MHWSLRSFLLGFLAAACILGGIIVGGVHLLGQSGVTVQLDTSPVAQQIEVALADEARAQIDLVVHSVREDLPRQVATQVAGTFDSLSFSVYGVEVPLPEAVIDRLEDQLRQSLESEVKRWVDAMQWDHVVDDLITSTEDQLLRMLHDPEGLGVELTLPGRWKIPVHIEPSGMQ